MFYIGHDSFNFKNYRSIVLFGHFIILVVSFIFVENEDYLAFIAAILMASFVIFLMNYENNPSPMDEVDMSNLLDEQFADTSLGLIG